MKSIVAVNVAKLAKTSSQLIGKGGGNIPGVVARKVDRNILRKLSSQVETTIVITGTNGKTTTSNLLGNILKQTGEPIIHNAEGNNLLTGVTASYVTQAKPSGRLRKKFKYAVLEVDESNVPLVLKEVEAQYVIINNFFRDQLDRVGEIDVLVEKVKKGIEPVSTTLVLNADDPFVMRIGQLDKPAVHFGIKNDAYQFDQFSMSESKFCPSCGNELRYDYVHYGHLGYFSCDCGFSRPAPKYETSRLSDDMSFNVGDSQYHLGIKGAYNIYNALGAIAVAKELNISDELIGKGLSTYQAENGRMESFEIGGSDRLLNLVKNPAGLDITISEVLKRKGPSQVVLFLNDLSHDSQDISWIWDTDIERFSESDVEQFVCSGIRAEEFALRLKYAGVPEEKIHTIKSYEGAVEKALSSSLTTYFLPTYTALDPVKKILEKKAGR